MPRFRVLHCQNRYGQWYKAIVDTKDPNARTPWVGFDHVHTTHHDTYGEAKSWPAGRKQERPE